jgi:hypothetical protein
LVTCSLEICFSVSICCVRVLWIICQRAIIRNLPLCLHSLSTFAK